MTALKRILVLSFLTACQAPSTELTGFAAPPGITTVPAASTDEGSTTSGETAEDATSAPGTAGPDSTPGPARDLGGMPDFGDRAPIGCKGKIDLLFVISRDYTMDYIQSRLVAAFPEFIATIEATFADFDYHIMVVTGDDGWGSENCTKQCPTLACKVGEACCSWYDPDWEGKPCCPLPDYPCDDLYHVTACDQTWGAGEIFPAGGDVPTNDPCPIDSDLRYLVKGQTDLPETFACRATVGTSGDHLLGRALVAAVQQPINDPGGVQSRVSPGRCAVAGDFHRQQHG